LTDAEIDAQLEELAKTRKTAHDQTARRAKLRRLVDTKAIATIEAQYGDQNVHVKEVPFIDSETPILVAVRTPSPAMVKNYRAAVEPDDDGNREIYQPAEDLAIQCLVYPDKDDFLRMREARYGIGTQMGLAALNLATAKEERRGKA
jgi:hypothetical protein